MSGILLNVAFITLVGCIILIIRKVWGETLHPQVLKGLWILFFLCALCPMSSVDRLGRAVLQEEDKKPHEIYSWHHEEYYNQRATEDMDSMYSLCGTIIWMKAKEIFPIVWAVGCIIILLYKAAGAFIFYYKSRADYKYTLEPEKLKEKGISLSVPVWITENTGPMVLGIRPAVYVPERFLQGDESLFQSMVLHEKEHVVRKHHLLLILINLTGSIYWFLPYVERIFLRALREDMEYRCDYELIRKRAVEAKEYAKHCIAIAQDRGRLCNELLFGERGLKKRVCYIQHNRKKTIISLMSGIMACIMVFVCLMGVAFYYKRDAQGFTRWEVEEAKAALINYVDAQNGRKEGIETYIAEDSPYRDGLSRVEGRDAVFGITYRPDDWSYWHYVRWDSEEEKGKNIYFTMKYEWGGTMYQALGCHMVRKDANSPWKLYGLYTGM